MDNIPVYYSKHHLNKDFPFKVIVRRFADLPNMFHAHESLQICYVRKGSCYHTIFEKRCVLMKGDIFVVPKFVHHRIEPSDSKDIELVQIDFMPYTLGKNMEDLADMENFIDFAYIQPFVFTQKNLLAKVNLSSSSQIAVEQLIEDIQKEMECKEYGYCLSIRAAMTKLIVIISREFLNNKDKESIENHTVRFHREALFRAIRYIEDNYANKLTLKDVAAIANMSAAYFSHIFKLLKGKSFVSYVNSIRIYKALDLLCHTNMSMLEICFSIGFENISHFNKVFKEYTGNTPTGYKKNACMQMNSFKK